MNRKELFEMLGAPLNNYQWSWGAVREDDGSVFLCVWGDEVRHHNGAQIVPLTGFVTSDHRHGNKERLEHIHRIQRGAHSYLIMIEALDPTARPRQFVRDFESPDIYQGGQTVEVDGKWWIEVLSKQSLEALLPKAGTSA